MTTTNWHRFRDTDDGDDQCATCGVVVTLEATMTFTTPCPAGDCPSAKNPDRGCVFVPGKEGPCVCIYCGRSGDRDHETDEPEPDDDLAAEQDAIAATLVTLDQIAAGDILTFTLETDPTLEDILSAAKLLTLPL